MEFSELFVFASFGIVRFSKFRNFPEISSLFELAKILQKYLGNNFQFLGQKVWKSSERSEKFRKVQKVWKFGICSIPNITKITKK